MRYAICSNLFSLIEFVRMSRCSKVHMRSAKKTSFACARLDLCGISVAYGFATCSSYMWF
jgi:hypothetical protein